MMKNGWSYTHLHLGEVGRRARRIELIVNIEANHVRTPLDRIDVKGVGKVLPGWE